MTTLRGSANGVGGLSEPVVGWDAFPNTGSAFLDGCEYVRNAFSNGTDPFVTKMFMGPTYFTTFYTFDTFTGTPTTLKLLAQESQFATVFGDVNFPVFIIDAFTFNDGGGDLWKFEVNIGPYLDAEYTEMYDFVKHLLDTFTGKTFVITDQEGDFSLISSEDINDSHAITWNRIDNMVAWHHTRQRAVRDAVKDSSSSSVAMYAPEVNRVTDCIGSPAARRVATKVLRRLNVDLIAYSAWDSLYGLQAGESVWHTDQPAMIARTNKRLTEATNFLREVSGTNIIWSEHGIPLKEVPVGYDESEIMTNMFGLAGALDVWGSIYWQVIDNEARGFELWSAIGAKTALATTFEGLVA